MKRNDGRGACCCRHHQRLQQQHQHHWIWLTVRKFRLSSARVRRSKRTRVAAGTTLDGLAPTFHEDVNGSRGSELSEEEESHGIYEKTPRSALHRLSDGQVQTYLPLSRCFFLNFSSSFAPSKVKSASPMKPSHIVSLWSFKEYQYVYICPYISTLFFPDKRWFGSETLYKCHESARKELYFRN